MSTTRSSRSILGRCPDCGATIAGHDILIEYETDDGPPAVWADCPTCGGVVHPE